MSDTTAKPRPQFRNLSIAQIATYRLPAAGKVSILHRASGALLFFCLPLVLLPLLGASLASPESFANIASVAGHPIVKLIWLALIWAYLHHFCAGIRYLLLDLHFGIDKAPSQKTAGVVLGVSLALTVVFGLKLFGAW